MLMKQPYVLLMNKSEIVHAWMRLVHFAVLYTTELLVAIFVSYILTAPYIHYCAQKSRQSISAQHRVAIPFLLLKNIIGK